MNNRNMLLTNADIFIMALNYLGILKYSHTEMQYSVLLENSRPMKLNTNIGEKIL